MGLAVQGVIILSLSHPLITHIFPLMLLCNNHAVAILNPLSPHDALKHHFTSLKTDLIFLPLTGLEQKFP